MRVEAGGVQSEKHWLEFTSEASALTEIQEKHNKSSGTDGPYEDEELCIDVYSKKG